MTARRALVLGVALGWWLHREREAWRWRMGEYDRNPPSERAQHRVDRGA